VSAVMAGEIYNHASCGKGRSRAVIGSSLASTPKYSSTSMRKTEWQWSIRSRGCTHLHSGTRANGSCSSGAFGSGRSRCSIDDGGALLFASELDALVAGMDIELDPATVDAFFTVGHLPEAGSTLHSVKQPPAGHVIRWEHRSRRIRVEACSHSGSRWSGTAATARKLSPAS
jgi:hypothetical protein